LLALLVRWVLPDVPEIMSFLLLEAGCMAGVWVSFGARKTVLAFEDLHILEQDRLEPIVRLIFAGLLTLILGLLFSTQAIEVTLGAIKSAEFVNHPAIALLFGLLSGFSEQALSAQVGKQAANLVSPRP
jgi:hypothetical protein